MNIIIGRGPLSDEIYRNLSKNYFFRFRNFNFKSAFKIFKKDIQRIYIFADSNSLIYCIYLLSLILLFSIRNNPKKVIYLGSLSCCDTLKIYTKEIYKYSGLDYYSLRKKIVSKFFINLFKFTKSEKQVWHPGIILGRNQNWNKKLYLIAKYKKVKLINKNSKSAPLTYIDSLIDRIKNNNMQSSNQELIIVDKIISWEELINSFKNEKKSEIKYIYEKFYKNNFLNLKMIIKLFLKLIIFNTPIYYFYLNKSVNSLINYEIFEFDYRTKEIMSKERN